MDMLNVKFSPSAFEYFYTALMQYKLFPLYEVTHFTRIWLFTRLWQRAQIVIKLWANTCNALFYMYTACTCILDKNLHCAQHQSMRQFCQAQTTGLHDISAAGEFSRWWRALPGLMPNIMSKPFIRWSIHHCTSVKVLTFPLEETIDVEIFT